MKERRRENVSASARGPVVEPGPRRRWRPRHLAVLAAAVIGLAVGAPSAGAHDWGWWHWDRGGTYIPLYVWNTASLSGAAEQARADIHSNPHPVYLYNVGYHSDIHVFDYYDWWEANVDRYCGWGEIVDWRWWTPWTGHILHAHARYNRACGTTGSFPRAVFCQEVGHTLGLDHSNTGDCMGAGYFNNVACWGNTGCNIYDWDHQSLDLYYKYRYH